MAIWNVPKELASFEWSGAPPRSVVVCDPDGELVMSARWSQPRLSLPLPVLAPFLGTVDGDPVAGRLTGLARAVRQRVNINAS